MDGEIEVPVNLLETNEIAITVSGKPGAAVRAGVIVTRPAPTEITLGCATRGASGTGMIAGATVEVQFLDGTVLSETTGADGFCYFPDIPVGTVALVTASTTDGRMSSALAVFSESKDHVAIDLQMFPPGPGEVSGTIETLGEPLEGIVSILFSKTGYRAATIADASGAFSFNGLPLDGYFTLSIATPGDVLRSGSISRNLTETQPTWDSLDFSVKNPCPVKRSLLT